MFHCFYVTKGRSRDLRIAEEDRFAHLAISRLDQKFNLINEKITKVVDLGFAPGNWLRYIQMQLLHFHNIDPVKLQTKCTVVGLDLLFCQPPPGTYSIQGNIFSQNAHSNVLDMLKKRSFLLKEARNIQEAQNSGSEKSSEEELSALANGINSLTVDSELAYFDPEVDLSLYQADLITSDLAAAYLQRGGYFNNTMSKPYARTRTNEILRQPLTNPHKALLDLADAAMLLCCKTLAKNGTFVLRLADVRLEDPELQLLETRLKKVFEIVIPWQLKRLKLQLPSSELYFICQKKKKEIADKHELFDVERIEPKLMGKS